MSYQVTAGNFYIGAGDRDRVNVSLETIREWFAEHGFDAITVIDRTMLPRRPDGEAIVPGGFDPRSLPGYDDEWDTLVQARSQVTQSLDVDSEEIKWVVEFPLVASPAGPSPLPSSPSAPSPSRPQATPASSARWAIFAAMTAGGFAGGFYHGTKRNDSAAWGFWWGVCGAIAPTWTLPVAIGQGYAKPRP